MINSAFSAFVPLSVLSVQTLAYLLPILSKAIQRAEQEFEQLSAHGKANQAGTLQAIVVAPTRELAMQIMRVAQQLLPPEAKGTVQQCIGGANPHRQASRNLSASPVIALTNCIGWRQWKQTADVQNCLGQYTEISKGPRRSPCDTHAA